MATNALVTGPPRSGKTTAIGRAVDRLADRGLVAAGIRSPEVREGGERVGFEIRALGSDRRAVMATVAAEHGPWVGKYGVDVAAIDDVCVAAFGAEAADYLVVDEIAPMQLHSDVFVREVRAVLAADRPVLAAIADGTDPAFVATAEDRGDVTRFPVTADGRDELPAELADWIARQV